MGFRSKIEREFRSKDRSNTREFGSKTEITAQGNSVQRQKKQQKGIRFKDRNNSKREFGSKTEITAERNSGQRQK